MGIRRRSLAGGALGGLGEGLQAVGASRIQRRKLDEQRAQEQAFELQKMRLQALTGLSDKVASNPNAFESLLAGARLNPLLQGLDLKALKPPDTVLLRPLENKIQTASKPEDIPPDLGFAATNLGVDLPSVPPSNAAQFGAQADFADAPPELNRLMNAAAARQGQLTEGRQREVEDLGRKKYTESNATTSGTNAANNANFPTVLEQKGKEGEQSNAQRVALETSLNPVMAARTGAEEAARQNAQNAAKSGDEAAYTTERAIRTLQSIQDLRKQVGPATVGTLRAKTMRGFPGTDAKNFVSQLATLKGNIATQELQAMRNASKTGGALGQISNIELQLLESSLGSLDPDQGDKQFLGQLDAIENSVKRWHAAEAKYGRPAALDRQLRDLMKSHETPKPGSTLDRLLQP